MTSIVKKQLEMDVLVSRDLNGVEMGVLADGTPFLTGRGLAAVCGVVPSVVNEWAGDYDPNSRKPRDVAITRLLRLQGHTESLYIKTKLDGQPMEVNAYPEAVCMAVLEYYAFEAKQGSADRAQANFRVLARAGMRAFIYTALGYDPKRAVPDPFKSFHDRLVLNLLPTGVYSCFTETAHIVLAAIRAGLVVDSHTIPDISVGQAWSKHWTDNRLEEMFGERSKAPHTYPPDYPQSAVTPEAFVYPLASLGYFREWLEREYLPTKYPNYINRKVKEGVLPASRAELLIESIVPKALGSGEAAQ